MQLDLTKVCDIEFSGIDHRDAPDYCDAYISKAAVEITREEFNLCQGQNQVEHKGRYFRDATEAELDYMNESCPDWKYEKLLNWMH